MTALMFVVKWISSSGEVGWHPVDSVDSAAAHVEHLRNTDGVEGAKIFRLEEVAFELRPYYRVELSTPPPVSFATSIAPDPDHAPVVEPVASLPEAEPVAEPALAPVASIWTDADAEPAANGAPRRGLFGR